MIFRHCGFGETGWPPHSASKYTFMVIYQCHIPPVPQSTSVYFNCLEISAQWIVCCPLLSRLVLPDRINTHSSPQFTAHDHTYRLAHKYSDHLLYSIVWRTIPYVGVGQVGEEIRAIGRRLAICVEVGLWQGNYRGSVLAIGMKRVENFAVEIVIIVWNWSVIIKCNTFIEEMVVWMMK